MAEDPRSGREDRHQEIGLVSLVVKGAFWFGTLLVVAGLWLVSRGSGMGGEVTEIELFGQKIQSGDIGIVAIFIGAVTVVVLVVRALKSLETIRSIPGEKQMSKQSPFRRLKSGVSGIPRREVTLGEVDDVEVEEDSEGDEPEGGCGQAGTGPGRNRSTPSRETPARRVLTRTAGFS